MVYYPGKQRLDPQPVDTNPHPPEGTLTTAKKMREFLQAVARTNGVGWTGDVDGVRVIERRTEDDGTVFYHLSHRAKTMLLAHGLLPWA